MYQHGGYMKASQTKRVISRYKSALVKAVGLLRSPCYGILCLPSSVMADDHCSTSFTYSMEIRDYKRIVGITRRKSQANKSASYRRCHFLIDQRSSCELLRQSAYMPHPPSQIQDRKERNIDVLATMHRSYDTCYRGGCLV